MELLLIPEQQGLARIRERTLQASATDGMVRRGAKLAACRSLIIPPPFIA